MSLESLEAYAMYPAMYPQLWPFTSKKTSVSHPIYCEDDNPIEITMHNITGRFFLHDMSTHFPHRMGPPSDVNVGLYTITKPH